MLIDTHAHVNFNAFKDDADSVLKRALENDISVIMPGTQYETSKRSVEMTERYEKGVYAAVGLHPIHLEERKVDVKEVQSEDTKAEPWMVFETKAEEFDYERYKTLALGSSAALGVNSSKRKVVAIGECGLDYYWEPKSKAKREAMRLKQKTALALQLKLAEELGLPVILHCRKAHNDLIDILNTQYQILDTKLRGVVHCYTGDLKQAEQFYNLGLYFGFNGLIFKDVPALPNPEEIIGALPLERIVLETDSPYLIMLEAETTRLRPLDFARGFRRRQGFGGQVGGQGRNEPVFVKYVAEEIARIKKIPLEEVASVTTENSKSLFQLSRI